MSPDSDRNFLEYSLNELFTNCESSVDPIKARIERLKEMVGKRFDFVPKKSESDRLADLVAGVTLEDSEDDMPQVCTEVGQYYL